VSFGFAVINLSYKVGAKGAMGVVHAAQSTCPGAARSADVREGRAAAFSQIE
jgi:hypothetical protein